MEAAVNAGEPQTAEQARLTAYAFFEFGPEIKLRAFDPGLALEVEGLMWYGAKRRGRARAADRRRGRLARDPRDPARPRRVAGGRPGEDGRGRQRDHRDHQLGADRLPGGARGGPDHRRDRRLDGRHEAAPAPPDPARGDARGARQHRPLLRRRPAPRLALAVRREARGDRRPGRDRGALTGAQLVLPQRLLDRVDQGPPAALEGADRRGRRRGGGRDRHRARPLHARVHQRLPRGLRDGALPPGAAAQLRDGDRPRRRLARAAADGGRSAPPPSRSSASSPTSDC